MKFQILSINDFYCKFKSFNKLVCEWDLFQEPDMIYAKSLDYGKKTFLSKVHGIYKNFLIQNSLNTLNSGSKEIVTSLKHFSNGPHYFKFFNDQRALISKSYYHLMNNKDLIHQISYQVYDPFWNGANIAWNSPIVSFNATLHGWKYQYIRDALSFQQYTPVLDQGNKWLEQVLWPVYRKTLISKFPGISQNLTNCLVKMTTLSSIDGITSLHGSIFALVRVGFYTTVWYKFIPFQIDIQPEELLHISWNHFLNENAVVDGYTKITLQETKDLSDIVSSIREDLPFPLSEDGIRQMLIMQDEQPPLGPPDVEIASKKIDRKWLTGVNIGVVTAFCVLLGIYFHPE